MTTRSRAASTVLSQSRSGLVQVRLGLPTQQAWPKCTTAAVDRNLPLTEELHRSGTVRPFSDIPIAGGAVPFLGHWPLLRLHQGVKFLKLTRRCFKELGPIFRMKFPCKTTANKLVFYSVVVLS